MPLLDDVHPITLGIVRCHLLVEHTGCTLIDTGLFGETWAIGRKLRKLNLSWRDIKAILLTHGHLDHTGNLAPIKKLTGAPIYCHPADRLHVQGRYPYRGVSRICGALEAAGRLAFRYKPVPIDIEITDGQVLPFWGGLEVVHLPGHTAGHCGFLSRQRGIIFIGDLVAHQWGTMYKPPRILNSVPEHFATSFHRLAKIDVPMMLCSHYSKFDPEGTKRRFDRYYRR
jgi:glyoxylase-like metal-dependent hydrolase (beta-lactamase superfamily II)